MASMGRARVRSWDWWGGQTGELALALGRPEAHPNPRPAFHAQQSGDCWMTFLFGPGDGSGPRLGVGLHRVCPAYKEPDELFATPTAGPAEGGALEEVVAEVHAGAGVED